MSAFLVWPGVAICAIVIGACICRIDQLKAGRHRLGWVLLYIMLATFALGLLIDLVTGRDIDWWVCAGMAAILLQLHLTRKDWRAGAPPDLEKARP
jgi:hypothetical protein